MRRAFVVILLLRGMYPKGSFSLEVSRTARERADSSTEDDDMPSLVCSCGITTTTVGGMFGYHAAQRCAGRNLRNWLREDWVEYV